MSVRSEQSRRSPASGPVLTCAAVADLLPGVSDGTTVLDDAARAHVESCLRCQAELVQYRKVLRALRALRTDLLEPAPGLLSDILATLEAHGERNAVRSLLAGRRAAYLGGLAAAATAAGAGAAIVLVNRNRRKLAS